MKMVISKHTMITDIDIRYISEYNVIPQKYQFLFDFPFSISGRMTQYFPY